MHSIYFTPSTRPTRVMSDISMRVYSLVGGTYMADIATQGNIQPV